VYQALTKTEYLISSYLPLISYSVPTACLLQYLYINQRRSLDIKKELTLMTISIYRFYPYLLFGLGVWRCCQHRAAGLEVTPNS